MLIPANIKKLLIIAVLIACGIMMEIAGLFDAEEMLALARTYADYWWLALVLVLLQVLLFTFALAGSFFLWIVAPLYPPLTAALILVAGGTLGGIGAYLFSRRLTDDWISKVEYTRTYRLLHKQDGFFMLFALRILPAFPHSLVNYSSGIIKVKLRDFIAAAILGIGIKSYLYAKVIYTATSSVSFDELISLPTLAPLFVLSALSLCGVYIQYRLNKNTTDSD